VVGLSWLSCIRVRRLLFPDVVLIFLVDLGGKGEWPDVGCLTACNTIQVIRAVKHPTSGRSPSSSRSMEKST